MTKEQLKEKFLELSRLEGIKDEEKVFETFLNDLEIPFDKINDLNDLVLYEQTNRFDYFYVWVYTDKCDYQVCFTTIKEEKNELEIKKELLNDLINKVIRKEQKEKEEEEKKLLNIQNKVVKLLEKLDKDFAPLFAEIHRAPKYENLDIEMEIFRRGSVNIFKARFNKVENKFYLVKYCNTTFASWHCDFKKYNIEQLEYIGFGKEIDFNEQEIVDKFNILLDYIIKKLQKDVE
jgi:hypothetical protein